MPRCVFVLALLVLATGCQARPSDPSTGRAEAAKNWWEGLPAPGEVVLHSETMDTPLHTGVLVVYRERAGQPSSCLVSIFDLTRDKAELIARNDQFFECAEIPSAESAAAQIEVSKIGLALIELKQTGSNSSADFELQWADGRWVVSKASYTHPEEHLSSGDVMVVQEATIYRSDALPVNEFNFDRIKQNLVRTVIE